MKKLKFYICPTCGNVITATEYAVVNCCGMKLEESQAKKAEPEEKLSVELIENEYYVTSEHPMVKEHYIDFVAFVNGDMLILRKQYPEWDLSTRIPRLAYGKLIWHCTNHGLFYQPV